MKTKYLTTSAFQTKKLGEDLAKKILKSTPQKRALVIVIDTIKQAILFTFVFTATKSTIRHYFTAPNKR